MESKTGTYLAGKSCRSLDSRQLPVRDAETLMVTAIHRGVVGSVALAFLFALLCPSAIALNRNRAVSQFYHTASAAREGDPGQILAAVDFLPPSTFLHTGWFVSLCALSAGALLWLVFALRLRYLTGQLRARLAERLSERERISRELHDTLLQSVAGLILRFQIASENIPASDPARQMLDEALRQSDKVLEEGRERVLGLRVSPADANELAQAFVVVGMELKQEHPADFSVVVNGEPRELHPIVRDEVYRIGREAIANSFQHANPVRCETEINYDRTQLRISFRDDGRGVDAAVLESERRSGNWGLPGMYERARKIGARLEVWSRAGVGTEVELRVPATIAYSSGTNLSRWQWLRRLATGDG
jgi:signal transduction histidine kinase